MVWVKGMTIRERSRETVSAFFRAPEYLAVIGARKPDATAESFTALLCLAELLRERGIAPGVSLARDSAGRPFLPEYPALDFSITHSVGVAFCALSDGGRIGIDAELLRKFPNAQRLAARFFSPDERGEDFFRIWTRKEAYLKYLGTGMTPEGMPNGLAGLDTTRLAGVTFHEANKLGCLVTVCTRPDTTVEWKF